MPNQFLWCVIHPPCTRERTLPEETRQKEASGTFRAGILDGVPQTLALSCCRWPLIVHPQSSNQRVVWTTIRTSRTLAPGCPGGGSPRSSATRSATEIAAIRRGCVHTTLQAPPAPASAAASSRYCGTC